MVRCGLGVSLGPECEGEAGLDWSRPGVALLPDPVCPKAKTVAEPPASTWGSSGARVAR